MQTYSSIIEPKSKERQLKVEILVDLRSASVNIPLVISMVFVTTPIVEPVHEIPSNLSQSLLSDDVWLAIVLEGCGRQIAAVNVVCKK